VAHLQELPVAYATRVRPAQDAGLWGPHCISPQAARWVAWNVCEDFWYTAEELVRVQRAIDEVGDPGLEGPELLTRCARKLQLVHALPEAERDHLPAMGLTHVVSKRFKSKYELAPGSDADDGSASGELEPTLVPGKRFRVLTSGSTPRRWLTFDLPGETVSKDPDRVACRLGVDWDGVQGNVVRVEVPIDVLRGGGATMAIPTLFDRLDLRYLVTPDWRARPAGAHRPGEPWGHARDMERDGPALPEFIADITRATEMDAEILGPVQTDWSTRPYLTRAGSAPQ
jgi:hypothetical protein